MKSATQIALIFCIHVAFMYSAVSLRFFGIYLPSYLSYLLLTIWLGLSPLIAAFAYSEVFAKSDLFGGVFISSLCAVLAASTSLYVGIVLIFNTYGS